MSSENAYKIVSDNELIGEIRGTKWRISVDPPAAAVWNGQCWEPRDHAPACALSVRRIARICRQALKCYERLSKKTDERQGHFSWYTEPYRTISESRNIHQKSEAMLHKIPPEIRNFLSTFRSGAFGVWRAFCFAGPAYLELLESNPLLGWMLAQPAFLEWQPQSPHNLRRLILAKRTVQLAQLHFTIATPAVERILRLVPARVIGLRLAQQMRHVLADPTSIRLLSHLDVINTSIVCIVRSPALRRITTPKLLQSIASDEKELHKAGAYRQLRAFIQLPPEANRPTGPFENMLEVSACLIRNGVSSEHDSSLYKVDYPAAPIAPSENVERLALEPVSCLQELIAESRQMRHCVQSYEDQILKGTYFVYRIHKPERATLGLERDGSLWKFDQLQGRANAETSEDLLNAVMTWIAFSQQVPSVALLTEAACNSRAVVRYISRRMREARDDMVFPPAPFQDGERIRPLRSVRELLAHIRSTRNWNLVKIVPGLFRGARYAYELSALSGRRCPILLIRISVCGEYRWHLERCVVEENELVCQWLALCGGVPDFLSLSDHVLEIADEEPDDDVPF